MDCVEGASKLAADGAGRVRVVARLAAKSALSLKVWGLLKVQRVASRELITYPVPFISGGSFFLKEMRAILSILGLRGVFPSKGVGENRSKSSPCIRFPIRALSKCFKDSIL